MLKRNNMCVLVLTAFFLLAGIAGAVALKTWDLAEMTDYDKIETYPYLTNIASSYTQTMASDPQLHRQWGLDDTNADVVRKTFKTELDKSSADIFVVIPDYAGVDITNSDLKNRIYYLSKDVYGYIADGKERIVSYEVVDGPTPLYNPIYAYGEDLTTDNWKDVVESAGANYGEFLHGTHIAGVVAAEHNGKEIAGIDPKVHIIVAVVQYDGMIKDLCDWVNDTLYPLLQKKTGNSHPRIIIQSSLGGVWGEWRSDTQSIHENLASVKKLCDGKGVLFVQAAGNGWQDLGKGFRNNGGTFETSFPYNMGVSVDNFLSVANHRSDRNLEWSSNYSTSHDQAQVHVSAPGTDIVSTGRGFSVSADRQVDEAFVETGTSMAAPHVSGVAALLWRLFPDATAAQIKQLIVQGAAKSNKNKAGHYNFGDYEVDYTHGSTIGDYVRYGYLDAAESVAVSKAVLGAGKGRSIVIPLKRIALSTDLTALNTGSVSKITVTALKPDNAASKAITLRTDNANAVSIAGDALNGFTVTGKSLTSAASADVWAEAQDGFGAKSESIRFTVAAVGSAVKKLTVLGLSSSAGGSIAKGGSTVIGIVPEPADAQFDPAAVLWSVASGAECVTLSGSSGATVTLTGTAAGSAVIAATAEGVTGTINVAVTDDSVYVTGISLSQTSLSLVRGGSAQLYASVNPSGAAQQVSWNSSNMTVATVDANGCVNAVGAGSTVITAVTSGTRANGTQAAASCKVTVTENGSGSSESSGGGGCNAGGYGTLALFFAAALLLKGSKHN